MVCRVRPTPSTNLIAQPVLPRDHRRWRWATMPGMAIEAVVFDIGGVLELNPATRWQERWAAWAIAQLDHHLA